MYKRNSRLSIVKSLVVFLVLGVSAIGIASLSIQSLENRSDASATPTAYSCQPNDPPAVLTKINNVPGVLKPGQKTRVSFSIANCSGETWLRGLNFKLGSQNPPDNKTWGTGRVELPLDLASSQQMEVSFEITAPTQPGAYPFQWGIVQEGKKWLSPSFTPSTVLVGRVTDCSAANNLRNKKQNAQPAIQDCINKASEGDIITLQEGEYQIDSQIKVNKTISLVTKGLENKQALYCLASDNLKCAQLIASASYPANPQPGNSFEYAMLRVQKDDGGPVERVGIKNLVLNGNRGVRQTAKCITANTCVTSSLLMNKGVVSGNAFILGVSWTAMETRGEGSTFAYNFVANNGTKRYATLQANEALPMTWSDGFSIINVKNVTVMSNIFHDNTDVDLILWGGTNAQVHFNRIEHFEKSQEAFAAFALEANTAEYPDFANFSGAVISYNRISCNYLCGIGMSLGTQTFRPDYQSVYGAKVVNNQVDKAIQGINLEGGGIAQKPIAYANNAVSNSGGYATGCGFSTSAFNVSPNSHIYFEDGKPVASTKFAWSTVLSQAYQSNSGCKIPSCLFGSQYCKK